MKNARSVLNKVYHPILLSLLIALAFLLLFVFRSFDDNSLVSWKWAFNGTSMPALIAVYAAAMGAASLLAGTSVIEKAPVPVLAFLSFLAGMLFWSEPEVIIDASRYFTQAKHLAQYGTGYFFREWGRDIQAWTDLPLVPFLYGLIFRVFGETRLCIQIAASLFFTMTVITTYHIGRVIWDEQTGIGGGLLLLGIPYLMVQIPLMLVDVPTMFFLSFAVMAFTLAVKRGGAWISVSSAATALALFAKFSTWIMLSVLCVVLAVFAVQKKEELREKSRAVPICRGLAALLVSFVLVAAIVLLKPDIITGQLKLLLEYQKPMLKTWHESFTSTFLFQIHPFITLAALCSMVIAIRKRDLRYAIACWLVLLIIVLQIRRARYVLITFPFITLMASYGLQVLRTERVRKLAVFCIVLSSLSLAGAVYVPFLKGMSMANLQRAGAYLDGIEEKAVEVITLQGGSTAVNMAVTVPILDMYTDKHIDYDYDPGAVPAAESISRSSFRFSWEYKNPRYYAPARDREKSKALAVITNGIVYPLPEMILRKTRDYRNSRVYNASRGLFHFSPVVTIYHSREISREGQTQGRAPRTQLNY